LNKPGILPETKNIKQRIHDIIMNIKHMLAVAGVVLACQWGGLTALAQEVETVAPVVVKTVPEAGTKDVAPGVVEIRVKFSKPMMDGSWSWANAWPGSVPDGEGQPHYEADRRTCVLKAKLEPGTTYGIWLNSPKYNNFKDMDGKPAVPYLLVFKTKDK
jgi:RNA polymerase sigma-70 factor (ECF subfamily)